MKIILLSLMLSLSSFAASATPLHFRECVVPAGRYDKLAQAISDRTVRIARVMTETFFRAHETFLRETSQDETGLSLKFDVMNRNGSLVPVVTRIFFVRPRGLLINVSAEQIDRTLVCAGYRLYLPHAVLTHGVTNEILGQIALPTDWDLRGHAAVFSAVEIPPGK